MDPCDVAQLARDDVVSAAALRLAGHDPGAVGAAVRTGALVPLIRGWYAVRPPRDARDAHWLRTIAALRRYDLRAAASHTSLVIAQGLPDYRLDLSTVHLTRASPGVTRNGRDVKIHRPLAVDLTGLDRVPTATPTPVASLRRAPGAPRPASVVAARLGGMPSDTEQTIHPEPVFAARGGRLDTHHDGVRFEDTDFTGAHAESHSFLECTLRGARLDDVHLEGSRWSECAWERVQGVGVSLVEASLADTTLDGCRLAAVSAWGSTWRDVTVRGGKVDLLTLRGARLKDVAFVDCVVTELDLAEARVDGLTFEGCTLVEPTFGRGAYAGLDLSGATLRSPRGLAGLRGATLSRPQVIDLADALAAELGIVVRD